MPLCGCCAHTSTLHRFARPRALTDGASAILARLEAQFAGPEVSSSAQQQQKLGDSHPALRRADAAAMTSLTGAVDDLERALASSAAAVAGAVGGGGAATTVQRWQRRLLSAPPAVRVAALLIAGALFIAAVYILNFYGGEEEENVGLEDGGVVFKKDAQKLQNQMLQTLSAAGEDGQAAALAMRQHPVVQAGRRLLL